MMRMLGKRDVSPYGEDVVKRKLINFKKEENNSTDILFKKTHANISVCMRFFKQEDDQDSQDEGNDLPDAPNDVHRKR